MASKQTTTQADERPVLYGLEIKKLVVTIRGTSPLLVNRFSDEVLADIAEAQSGAAKRKKAPRDPQAEFEKSRYLDDMGRDCLPAAAFKESLVRACTWIDGLPMTEARGAFFIDGDMLPLRTPAPPRMHSSRVVLNRKTTSIAYRACYDEWECDLSISYHVLTAEQIINIIELAGFSVGVGAWRPQCRGQFGRFQIKRAA